MAALAARAADCFETSGGLDKAPLLKNAIGPWGASGFVIGADFEGVTVELAGDHFRVSRGAEIWGARGCRVSLYSYRGLMSAIAASLLADWRPRGEYPPRWLYAWKLEKTRRILGKQVHGEWTRLLGQVDPTVLAVQRAMFAASFDPAATPLPAEAYSDKHIVHDLVSYRAAAVVASRLHQLTATARNEHLQRVSEQIQNSAGMRCLAEEHGVALETLRVVPAREVAVRVLVPAFADLDVAVLRDWRATLSYSGHQYRSLNRTLDRLPGAIPVPLLFRLRGVALERPITQRLELLALLHATGSRNLPVFMHATAEQIQRAARLVIESNRWGEMPLRRSANVGEIVHYIQDYPGEHRGNVVGLAEKSIRWHRDCQEEERRRVLAELGGDRETALPPIEPPVTEGVRFLATVGEVAEEGTSMVHCLASYAREAVAGHCFLFHVEHSGETASVQVDHTGRVIQASGPRNRRNVAARWGKRALSGWGRRFPPAGELPPLRPLPAAPVMQPALRQLPYAAEIPF